MKRSSSSLDQQSAINDDELYQVPYKKVVRRSPPRSEYNNEEKYDHRKQQTSMDPRVVRQDLLYFLDGIFFSSITRKI